MCPSESAFWYPLDKYLVKQLLDHRIVLFLIFFRNLHTIFQNGCTSLHSHHVKFSHPDRCEVLSHCGFELCSLTRSDNEPHYTCLFAIWKSFFEKCLFMSSDHFFTRLFCFFSVEFEKFFIDFGY